MANAKIRPRRGTVTQWATVNPILAEGEIGIEFPNTGVGTGKVKIKFGDGSTRWNSLPYAVEMVDESTVRYNETNDTIELKAGNEWIEWKNAGLQGEYIIRDGVLNSDYTFSAYYDTTMSVVQESDRVVFKKPSTTPGALVANGIDMTSYSKLKFTVLESSNANNYIAICGNATTGDMKSQLLVPSAGDYEIDLSSISGVKYITVGISNANSNNKIAISNMYFE